jgi:hypothetical protein
VGVFVGQGAGVNDAAGIGEMVGASGGVTTDSDRRIPAIAIQRIANNKADENNCLTNMMSL